MGLVKEVENDNNLTKTGRGLGTPHYMAPEQFRNAKNVDVRGDVYSLGATLYAMVTGTVPFENSNPLDCWMKKIRNEFPAPKELNKAVSDRVDWAIRRAMSAEPAQRPASCREFLEDLTGQSRTGTTPSSTAPPPGRGDVWYMVYKDELGQTHTVKGATEGIRKALKDNLLGDASKILVGRTKGGQFVSIGSVAEFRDMVVEPAPVELPGRVRSGDSANFGASPIPPDSKLIDSKLVGKKKAASGRIEPPAPRLRTPPQVLLTPEPPPEAHAETVAYPADHATPLPAGYPAPRRKDKPKDLAPLLPVTKPFDWTPIILVVVALLSAVAGYLLFFR
jgi:serine/threonine protein kinase